MLLVYFFGIDIPLLIIVAHWWQTRCYIRTRKGFPISSSTLAFALNVLRSALKIRFSIYNK